MQPTFLELSFKTDRTERKGEERRGTVVARRKSEV
jgi:hypothetical protein